MESFYIELNEMSNKKPRMIKLWVTGALVLVVLFLVSFLVLANRSNKIEWLFLAAAVYVALYVYYAYTTYKAKLFIQADEFGLEYKFGLISGAVNSIMWDVVTKVKLGPTYMAFFKRSGKRKIISLSWLPYAKVIDIKEKVSQMCEFKGIPFEIAEFHDVKAKK